MSSSSHSTQYNSARSRSSSRPRSRSSSRPRSRSSSRPRSRSSSRSSGSYHNARATQPKKKTLIHMNRVTTPLISGFSNTHSLQNLARTQRNMNRTLDHFIRRKLRSDRIPTPQQLATRRNTLTMGFPGPVRLRRYPLPIPVGNASASDMLSSNLGRYNRANSIRRGSELFR